MRNSFAAFLGLLATTGLVAAAAKSAPPAAPTVKLDRNGFFVRQITADRFVVGYTGNAGTSDRLLMKRLIDNAAQLTLDNGFDHFIFDERDAGARQIKALGDPRRAAGSGGQIRPVPIKNLPGNEARAEPGPYPFGADGFHGRWLVRELRTNSVTAVITMGRGERPTENDLAIDARNPLA